MSRNIPGPLALLAALAVLAIVFGILHVPRGLPGQLAYPFRSMLRR